MPFFLASERDDLSDDLKTDLPLFFVSKNSELESNELLTHTVNWENVNESFDVYVV